MDVGRATTGRASKNSIGACTRGCTSRADQAAALAGKGFLCSPSRHDASVR